VTADIRLVVTFHEVGLAAAVAGLGLVSMTVGATRKEISEGLLVRVFADWDMGQVELHAVFPARKAAKPFARAFVDLLASSTVMIVPSGSQLRSESPSGPAGMALIDPVCAAVASKAGQIAPNCC
jgi:LysR substrate binding domain